MIDVPVNRVALRLSTHVAGGMTDIIIYEQPNREFLFLLEKQ
jgi:hypothetical protein